MNESADSRKANNEKKGLTIEDKLKKLQSAGLMSDVRDVISTGEAATDVAADTLDKIYVDKTIDAGNGRSPADNPTESVADAPVEEGKAEEEEYIESEIDEQLDESVAESQEDFSHAGNLDVNPLIEDIEEHDDLLSMSGSMDEQNGDESISDAIVDIDDESLSDLA